MVFSISHCSLPSCNAAVSLFDEVTCPHCADVPQCDRESNTTSAQYCCEGHLQEHTQEHECGKRRTDRDMVRIASLYNDTVLEQLRALHWEILLRIQYESNGCLHLTQMAPLHPTRGLPQYHPLHDERSRMAVMCANRCRTVIIGGSAFLAFLVEGLPFTVSEVDFADPRPARTLKLYMTDFSNLHPINTNFRHSLLKYTPHHEDIGISHVQENGMVSDGSHPQYWLDNGIDDYQSYRQKNTWGDPKLVTECKFGTILKEHLVQVRNMREGHAVSKGVYDLEAAIRISNNVVYAEINTLGGRHALLEMTHQKFLEAKQQIMGVLHAALATLRSLLEDMYFLGIEGIDPVKLMQDFNGEGHRACMAAFERITGD